MKTNNGILWQIVSPLPFIIGFIWMASGGMNDMFSSYFEPYAYIFFQTLFLSLSLILFRIGVARSWNFLSSLLSVGGGLILLFLTFLSFVLSVWSGSVTDMATGMIIGIVYFLGSVLLYVLRKKYRPAS